MVSPLLKRNAVKLLLVLLLTSFFVPLINVPLVRGDVESLSVGASVNDGGYFVGSWDSTGGSVYAGMLAGSESTCYFRFEGVDIPYGATIDSAYFYPYTYGKSGTPLTVISGIKELNTSDLSSDPSGRDETSASVDWDDMANGYPVQSPDIAAVVQEIVNQVGWASGNALALKWANDGGTTGNYITIWCYDFSSSFDAELSITYSGGGGPETIVLGSLSYNSTRGGGYTEYSASVAGTSVLDYAWMETNATGSTVNGTAVSLGSVYSTTAEVSVLMPAVGNTVLSTMYANDTNGLENATSTIQFSTTLGYGCWYQTSGADVQNATDSSTAYLRGVNWAFFAVSASGCWYQNGTYWSGYAFNHWDETGIHQRMSELQTYGANIIRCIFWVDWWNDNDNVTMNGQETDIHYWDAINQTISIAADYGIFVVLVPYGEDLAQGAVPYPTDEIADLDEFEDFWLNVTLTVGMNENVGFDLWGEPQISTGTLISWESVVATIRSYSDALIITQIGYGASYGWVPTVAPTLAPYGGILYSNHIYNYPFGATLYGYYTDYSLIYDYESIYDVLYNDYSYSSVIGTYPMFIGEFGAWNPYDPEEQEYWAALLDMFGEWNASYCAWEWGQLSTGWDLQTAMPYELNIYGQMLFNAITNGSDVSYPVDLQVSATSGGSVSPSVGNHSYLEGTNVTLVATESEGYDFAAWEIDGVNETTTASTWYVVMDDNRTAKAYFEINPADFVTGASNNTLYFRSDTYVNNGVTGYGLDFLNTDYHTNKSDTGTGDVTVYYGFRVWLVTFREEATELTSGSPAATISRSNENEGYQQGNWTCSETDLQLGFDCIKVIVYIKFGSGDWQAEATFISDQLEYKKIETSSWVFTVYTKRSVMGNTEGGLVYGSNSFNSGISGVSFTSATPQEIALARGTAGDWVAMTLYPFLYVLDTLFYGLAMLFLGGVYYLRYKRWEPVLILIVLFGGGGALGFLIPNAAFRLLYITILFVVAVILYRVFH